MLEKIEKRLISKDKKNIKESIEKFIIENVLQLKKKYEISEVGIAVPGTVTEKIIVKSVNLGVENYALVEELEKKIKLPIKIRNDAKCAALAEVKCGALREYKRTVFLTLGTGIGGAVIIDNKILDTGKFPQLHFTPSF